MNVVEINSDTVIPHPINIGAPCVTVRFKGCNLACNYCDYDTKNKTEIDMTVYEIVAIIKQSGLRHVLLTGGEPLLQDELGHLLHQLRREIPYIKTTVETNGSFSPLIVGAANHIVMSIKLYDNELSQKAVKFSRNLTSLDTIKMIYTTPEEYEHAWQIIEQFPDNFAPIIGLQAKLCLSNMFNHYDIWDRVIGHQNKKIQLLI